MYKGSRKSILVFKGDGKTLFNEAQFIIDEDKAESSDDIIKEANRIIAEYTDKSKHSQKNANRNTFALVMLALGFMIGFGMCILSFVIFRSVMI